MNGTALQAQDIFQRPPHGGVGQDKQPPWRLTAALRAPATAAEPAVGSMGGAASEYHADPPPAVDRPTHHGSEIRRTAQVTGRVLPVLKTQLLEVAKQRGAKTESRAVAMAVEVFVANEFGKQFLVMIRQTIQETVKTELQKDRAWLRKINLSEFLASEQARLHAIDVHRLLIPPNEDINNKIKENRSQAFKNLPFYFRTIEVHDEQQSWPSLK
jgi:hypothetical protein